MWWTLPALAFDVPSQGSLADALASQDAVIVIAAGPLDVTGPVFLDRDVTILGSPTSELRLYSGGLHVQAGAAVTLQSLVIDGRGVVRPIRLTNGDLSMDTVVLRNGLAAGAGGGNLSVGTGTTAVATNSSFETGVAGWGGAVVVDGMFTCVSCTFTDNRVEGVTYPEGGAVRGNGVIDLEDCLFQGNSSPHVGGAIMGGPGSMVSVHGGVLRANDAQGGGGISLWLDATLEVSGTTFEDQTAIHGGDIHTSTDTPGAVAVVDVTASTFTGGTAVDAGGMMNLFRSDVLLTDSTIVGASSPDHGGAIRQDGGSMTITRTRFEGNASTHGWGGAIHSNAQDLQVLDSWFEGNTCGIDGGALHTDSVLTVERTTFCGNHSGTEGGAISTHGPSTLRNVVVALNTAGGDGAVTSGPGSLLVEHGWIVGNDAVGSADGIRCRTGASCAVTASMLAANPPTDASGSILLTQSLASGGIGPSVTVVDALPDLGGVPAVPSSCADVGWLPARGWPYTDTVDGLDLDGSAGDPGPGGGPAADPDVWGDPDGDGVASAYDCAPDDPAVHPDAVEIPANGIDDDCDGVDASIDGDTDTDTDADSDTDADTDSDSDADTDADADADTDTDTDADTDSDADTDADADADADSDTDADTDTDTDTDTDADADADADTDTDTEPDSDADTDTGVPPGSSDLSLGCGCQTGSPGSPWLVLLGAALLARRTRK